jgi:hypothetical protein
MFLSSSALCAGSFGLAISQDPQPEEGPKLGWFSSTELTVGITEGNSNTDSLGIKGTVGRTWEHSEFRLKLDAAETNTPDDRFRVIDAGVTWLPGETPPLDVPTTLVEPPKEPDVEKYFIEPRFERNFSKKQTWNAGASWDRNIDAGILNRYIAFGGVGHSWFDREDLEFRTNYGLSYTDREEDQPDPEKDETFAGLRLGWYYLNKFGKVTTFENEFTGNMSLVDTSDFSLDMTTSLDVAMAKHLSLKVSLQWLFNSEPALEDIDRVVFVQLHDPDGTPGSGDEFFESVPPGTPNSAKIEIDEVSERKKQLDTSFRTALVLRF